MTASLSPDSAAVMTAHLAPGERLLWAGQPKQGFALRALDYLTIPFMLCWLTFVVELVASVLKQEGSGTLWFAIPFLLFGAWFLVGRFWLDAKLRGRTFYGLTDRRAIIVIYWLRQQMRSVYLQELTDLRFTHRSDGTGTLEFFTNQDGFNRMLRFGYSGGYSHWPFASHLLIPPAFEMVADPLEVERLILKARDEAKASAAI